MLPSWARPNSSIWSCPTPNGSDPSLTSLDPTQNGSDQTPKIAIKLSTKNEFKKIIYAFFLKRLQLVNTFLLIDIRHSPQQNDIDFMNWLGINHIPFSIVFTKADKISFVQSKKLVNKYFNFLIENYWDELPPYFVTSSKSKEGRKELISYIKKFI